MSLLFLLHRAALNCSDTKLSIDRAGPGTGSQQQKQQKQPTPPHSSLSRRVVPVHAWATKKKKRKKERKDENALFVQTNSHHQQQHHVSYRISALVFYISETTHNLYSLSPPSLSF